MKRPNEADAFRQRRRLVATMLGAGALAVLGSALPVLAQPYPSKPVRIVVPFAPGGAVDIVARAIGQELSKRLGQPVVVENRTGAGGNIASEFVVKSPPDGYTLLMASPSNAANVSLYAKLGYDPARDLTPVALVGSVPTVMLASPSLPAKDLREFLALARSKPGSLTFGSGGSGTTEHLAGEMFKWLTKIDVVHVPYKGGANAMNDLMGGQISYMFTNQLQALPHIRAGKLRPLAIASERRSAALPDVATFAELGLPALKVSVWWGLMGPAGMPREVVERLNREVQASLASTEMKERLAALTADPIGGSPERFAAFFTEEIATWGQVVRASGAKAD